MIRDLITNDIFITIIAVWLLVALTKYAIIKAEGKKTTFYKELLITGGMPSGHSAGVAALGTIILLQQGFSPLFFTVALFGLLVIRDSFGVRYSVGQQAQVLNKLIKHDHLHEQVRVVAGHTPLQAAVGFALGIAVALAVHHI